VNADTRAFWLLVAASGLALAISGASLLRLQGTLAHAEGVAEALARRAAPGRAERAMAAWGRPWVETFLREHDRHADLAFALTDCQATFLTDIDGITTGQNRVVGSRIAAAEATARACVEPALGADLAARFVRDLHVRWSDWLEELGSDPR